MVGDSKRVVVFGAQGVLGGFCSTALRDAGFDVIRSGRRPESAADFRLADLADPMSLVAACGDADLLVTTVREPTHALERHALDNGLPLLSVAAYRSRERAELKELAEGARGPLILDAGLGPGLSSILHKELLAAHPDAEELEAASTFSAFEPSGRGTAVDGHPVFQTANRYRSALVDFPEPFGRLRCIRLGGPEADTMLFGDLASHLPVRFYVYVIEPLARAEFLALNAFGLLPRAPLWLFTVGSGWKKSRDKRKPQCHVAAVLRGGERIGTAAISGSGNYAMSATAMAAFAKALLDQRERGALPCGAMGVEEVFSMAELREHLETGGVRIASVAGDGRTTNE
jgi:hypothetical protein